MYLHSCTWSLCHFFIVTVARAVELKHNSSLISALANETSKLFLDAANTLRPFKPEIIAQWTKYLELKSAFYQSYVCNVYKFVKIDDRLITNAIKNIYHCFLLSFIYAL